jgi:hypothetical protein
VIFCWVDQCQHSVTKSIEKLKWFSSLDLYLRSTSGIRA